MKQDASNISGTTHNNRPKKWPGKQGDKEEFERKEKIAWKWTDLGEEVKAGGGR